MHANPNSSYSDIFIITAQSLLQSLRREFFRSEFFFHSLLYAPRVYVQHPPSPSSLKNKNKQIICIQNKLFIAFKSTRAGSTQNCIDDRRRRRRRSPSCLYILLLCVYRRLYTVRTQYYTYIYVVDRVIYVVFFSCIRLISF